MTARLYNFHTTWTAYNTFDGEPLVFAKGLPARISDPDILAELATALASDPAIATDYTALAALAILVEQGRRTVVFNSTHLTAGVLPLTHNFGGFPAGIIIWNASKEVVIAPIQWVSDDAISIDLSHFQVGALNWAVSLTASQPED